MIPKSLIVISPEPLMVRLAGHLFDEIKIDQFGKQFLICKDCNKTVYLDYMKECDLETIRNIHDL